jgi:uncharacterized membrane protein
MRFAMQGRMSTRASSTGAREGAFLRRAHLRAPSKSPSRSRKRWAAALLALLGAAVSSWLAAYQLGLTGAPWDPLFDGGTERVLTSSFSRSLPVPDAALGAVAYLAEVVALAWGGVDRYRTNPVAVLVYAGSAGAMAVAGIGLVLVQAFVVHAFCMLCLASAALSVLLVIPAATELSAMVRHRRSTRETR